MVWRVSRNYQFLLWGSRMSEREVAGRCNLCRMALIRLRQIPYDAQEDVMLSTTREIESVFDLPAGWLCLTPDLRVQMGVGEGGRVPAETAEGLRDQFPEWSFQQGSKALVLLAQDATLEEARAAVT